jgi:NitT/TauT family transport system permease protein
VTAGTRAGTRSVERNHRDLATTLQATRWQRLTQIDLPSSLPSILTGMEVGIVLATVGAIVAEYLSGSEGLGWLATFYLNQLQVDALFGVIVLMSALGLLLYAAVLGLRRLLVPWHQSTLPEHPSG